MVNNTSTTTFNLTSYQTIFNENDTSDRCRSVIDNIHPEIKTFFENFCREYNLLTPNRFLRDYSVTLQTTYSDSKNPKFAEQKKTSNTGRKYHVSLNENIGDQGSELVNTRVKRC